MKLSQAFPISSIISFFAQTHLMRKAGGSNASVDKSLFPVARLKKKLKALPRIVSASRALSTVI
jgi:hypothetical protein